jgi:hypothetical protein
MSRKNRRITNRGSHLPKVSVTINKDVSTVSVTMVVDGETEIVMPEVPNKEADIMKAVRKIRGAEVLTLSLDKIDALLRQGP